MKLPRWRLFPKYATLIILVVAGVLVVSGAFSLVFSWREIKTHLVALQVEKAQGAATRIEQYVLDIEHQLGWTAFPRMDAAADPVEQQRIEYLKLLRQVPAVTELVWVGTDGRERLLVSRLAMEAVGAGTDRSQDPAVRAVKGGKTYFGPVNFRKGTEPYMTIARRAGGDGGVTMADVNLKFVWDVVSRIKIGAGGLAYVVDATGTLIAHPDISLVLKKTDLKALPQVAALARPDAAEPVVARDLAGEEVFAAHARIPALNWTVFVESPRAEAFAPLYESIVRLALLLVAGLLVAAAEGFVLARALVRPISALQAGAARIGAGELDQRIDIKSGDELEGLAEQFNQMGSALQASYAGLERKVEERTTELSEALEYQTAISDVLREISGSPTDVAPVFEAIMVSAMRLFACPSAAVFRFDGQLVHLVATRAWPQAAIDDARRFYPGPPNPQMMSGRVILSGQAMVEEDTRADASYDQVTAQVGNWRRMIGAPMLKDGVAVGALVVAWPDPGKTPQRQSDLLKTFADQAVIAIENVRLFNETKEALETQTATADVLKVISQSPTDVQPVFDAIAERAKLLCGARVSGVSRFDGRLVHLVAYNGVSPEIDAAVRASFPMAPSRAAISARAVLERAPVQIEDIHRDPDLTPALVQAADDAGYRSNLAVPMFKDGLVVGSITVCRAETGQFPERQVKLLQTFADQAVIAIENVRLFNETKEALERQTATAEILRVISGSPTDVQPVLDTVAERSGALCCADGSRVWLVQDGRLRAMTSYGALYGGDDAAREALPMRRASVAGRAFADRCLVHVEDIVPLLDAEYRDARELQARYGFRTVLAVPMLREGQPIGVITLLRKHVQAFTQAQIDLVQTFADQAVIAIENVRLFNETKEALEQQRASADVLGAISGSIADTQPVFDKILQSCERLFTGRLAGIYLVRDDGLIHLAGYHGPGREEFARFFPFQVDDQSGSGAAILRRRVGHYPDVNDAQADVPKRVREGCAITGIQSMIFAPMLWEGRGIGAISVGRANAGSFTDKEIGLLRTFADQAVIAIQNARLVNETKQALERQTATSDVLQVISSSVSDTQPVFDRILESTTRLFGCTETGIWLAPGDGQLHFAAAKGNAVAGLAAMYPQPLAQTSAILVIEERRQVYFPDVVNGPDVPPSLRRAGEMQGNFSIVLTPMVWNGEGIGLIAVRREPNASFNDKELTLLRTFADQAVIAIQNARLFNETKEALEQQTATSEVLRVISSSVADTAPVFEKILQSCSHLFESSEQGVVLAGGDGRLHLGAHRGSARERLQAVFPIERGHDPVSLAMTEHRVLHYADVLRDAEPDSLARRVAERLGVGSYTQVFAPMHWEGKGVGYLYVIRAPVAPFSDKEIGLLKTFADQAAIAIQNARLFHEIEDKSRQLEAANRHKSEFLANMSHELRTPLNAIIGFSEVLTEQMFGELNVKQMEYLQDIHSSGQHLLALINDVLDLSKIEAGKMELDLSCFDLGLLLEHSAMLVRERAQRHGLALELDVGEGLAEWVADARKVKQVVVNLLSNAVKFTPNGGRVSVRARHLNGVDGNPGSWAQVAVSDTGVGIARADQALVFEEFRQAGGDVLRKAEGTGLGLALVKRFVELHGGTVALVSEPGSGSTFTFTLPQHEVQILQ